MERTCRKTIERIEKIIFIFSIFFYFFSFSEELILPEEEIIGKDLSLKKTQIFNFSPSISESISFPSIPSVEINQKVEREKEEKKEFIEFGFKFGNYDKSFNTEYENEKIKTGFFTFLKESYRENSEILWSDFYFIKKGNNNLFNIDLTLGKTHLPGPEDNPLNQKNNWNSLECEYKHFFDIFGFKISHKYYKIDEISTHFLNSEFDWNYKNLNFLFDIQQQIFKDNNLWSISQKMILENGNFIFGGSLKYIQESGLRFLPEFSIKGGNFSIFLNSSYEISDLWEDVEKSNYREIKKERLTPEEIYAFGGKINFKYIDLGILHSYNKTYVWEDIDGNSLYEPYKEKFWKTSLSLNSNIPFSKYFRIYFHGEKNFFNKDVIYFPEENFDAGIEIEKDKFLFHIWNSFTGKRKFIEKEISEFSILNIEIKYVKDFELGFGIYNILDKKYDIVPEYPEKGRRFVLWCKKRF